MSTRQQIHVHLERVDADRSALGTLGADGVAAAIAAQIGPRLPDEPTRAAPGRALEGQITTAIADQLRTRRELR
jgi:hypothetical protein